MADVVGTPRKRSKLSVPLRIWILAKDNGKQSVNESHVRDQVRDTNRIWNLADIEFTIASLEVWKSSTYYKITSDAEFDELEKKRWKRGNTSIDVYYVKKSASSIGPYYGKCSFPSPWEPHAIVVDDGAPNSTLAHELGHFFNLEHTFSDDLSDTQSTGDGDPENVMSYDRTEDISNIHLTVQQINRARRSAFNDRPNMITPMIFACFG